VQQNHPEPTADQFNPIDNPAGVRLDQLTSNLQLMAGPAVGICVDFDTSAQTL